MLNPMNGILLNSPRELKIKQLYLRFVNILFMIVSVSTCDSLVSFIM